MVKNISNKMKMKMKKENLYGLLILLYNVVVIGISIYIFKDDYVGYSSTLAILLLSMLITALLPNKSGRIRKNEFNGKVTYTVEQLHGAFRWSWTDAWVNSSAGAYAIDTYNRLEEAQNHVDCLTGKNVAIYTIIE